MTHGTMTRHRERVLVTPATTGDNAGRATYGSAVSASSLNSVHHSDTMCLNDACGSHHGHVKHHVSTVAGTRLARHGHTHIITTESERHALRKPSSVAVHERSC